MYVPLYDAVGGNLVCNLKIATPIGIPYGEQITLSGESVTNYFSPADGFLFDYSEDGYRRLSLVGWTPKPTPPNSEYLITLGSSFTYPFTLYAKNGNSIKFHGSTIEFKKGRSTYSLKTAHWGEQSYRIIAYDGTNYGGLFFKYSANVPNNVKWNGFGINRVAADYWNDESAFLADWLNGIVEEEVTDPFVNGGSSETGGGGGSFDNTSTPIQIPNLPSISAASTGFISLFNPTLNQLNELASYLWSDLFDVNGWKKLFADPMDAILGLSIVPVAVPSGGTREVKVGNIGTGISLTVASSQFVEVDCGSIDVNEYWGAYLDYEPYTQAQIFLPYIGTRPISVDEIMGKTVRVVYHVDILTGACCCFVKCGDSVLYTYNGQCSIPIPVTGANYTSVVNGVISVAASVGSLVATGGSSAPTEIPSIASSVVNQMKPQVEKSGSISGSAGVLNMQTPYLILIRPRQALPSKQNEFIGYPSLITIQLTELSGYTEIQSIHLENIPATQEELAEIESILKGGVIF